MGRIFWFLITCVTCACARVSAHKLSSDISDTYFQVLIRADKKRYFSPDISDRFSELYIDTFLRFYLSGHFGHIFTYACGKKYILDNGRGHMYFFVPDKEFEKSVRFVRESPVSPFLFLIKKKKKCPFVRKPPVTHHSISSLHGKKKTEGRLVLLRPP